MIILFISSLTSNIAAGMSWSVPASVNSQNKIDDVLWVNLSDAYIEHWSNVGAYHNYKEYGKVLHLKNLPYPYNKPDIVVFEGLYDTKSPVFAKELVRLGIPYIIVPRSSLTAKAQNNHAKWKKRIANILLYKRFVRQASSIQFLTEAERTDSGTKWNKNSFVLPNGFSTPLNRKTHFSNDSIKAIFVGRLDMFQKGIDVLLEACKGMQEELRKAHFTLCLYGPERYQYYEIKSYIDKNNLQDILSLGGETEGEHKEKVLLDSDLFVLTSRFEGHPMGLIEALAYGLPVFVTPGCNMANEIKQCDAGWVSDVLSKESIIDSFRTMIKERSLLNEKGCNSIKLANKYDWNLLATEFHTELLKIIESFSQSRKPS